MSIDEGWSANWISKHLTDQREVSSIDTLSNNLIQVRRISDIVLVGTLGIPLVRRTDVAAVLDQQAGIKFVANVPAKAKFSGDAHNYAKANGAALGGFGDLRKALSLPNPASYVDRETEFRETGLRQHDRVRNFIRLDDNKYVISRHELTDVTVVFLYDYDLSADAVRTAIAECGLFDAIIKMNPNGNISSMARTAASHAGRKILIWGELLRELNRKWS